MKLFKGSNGQMRALLAVGVALTAIVSFGGAVSANHSWGGYHWARQSNPFNLKLSDNLGAAWKPYLQQTSADWSVSEVLDTTIVAGTSNPKTCKPKLGQVEVCNSRYGQNGWLGLAQIWLTGSHITQGTTKLNDTYFAMQSYNTPAEKNHVMCQEVGHTFGLGHQDESGAALGTCMDYSMDLGSQHPNAHDYEELSTIYAHLDTTTTVGSVTTSTQADKDQSDKNQSANWGRRVFRGKEGHLEIYERQFQDGSKLATLVVLADHQ